MSFVFGFESFNLSAGPGSSVSPISFLFLFWGGKNLKILKNEAFMLMHSHSKYFFKYAFSMKISFPLKVCINPLKKHYLLGKKLLLCHSFLFFRFLMTLFFFSFPICRQEYRNCHLGLWSINRGWRGLHAAAADHRTSA